MKLKFLKDTVGSLAGKLSVDVVDLLEGKSKVNEFIIAKKLNLTINQIRNILYKLSDHGLVSFTRKKDKKKGWYTYFWTLDTEKTLNLLKLNVEKRIEQLKNQLKSRENKRYYICKTCNIELSEDNALLNDFSCLECGEVYELSSGDSAVKEMNSKLNSLESEFKLIINELGKDRDIKEKKMVRARKKEEKAGKKAVEKKAKKKAINKKAVKKSVKKKPIKSKKAKKISKKPLHKKTKKK